MRLYTQQLVDWFPTVDKKACLVFFTEDILKNKIREWMILYIQE